MKPYLYNTYETSEEALCFINLNSIKKYVLSYNNFWKCYILAYKEVKRK